MKIVQLTKYDCLAASTRQRFEQFAPFLQNAGLQVERWPLLDDAYLTSLYAGRRPSAGKLLKAYLTRAAGLLAVRDADLLWVQYELFPYLPGFAEALAKVPGCPIVYDFDDAIFHGYEHHRHPLVRRLLGDKLAPLLRASSLAFCGNGYLSDYAGRFAAESYVVPTVVDTRHYVPRASVAADAERIVGWIGTPSTWLEYLRPMMTIIDAVCASERARLLAIGTSPVARTESVVEYRPWMENEEIDILRSFDIGIMPLTDTPWARGKCGYKLIQYMACGLPVVASPVGVNAELVEHGVNGFLASTELEWSEALTTLLRNPELRVRMGAAGRTKIEREYSLQVWGPQVADRLVSICQRR